MNSSVDNENRYRGCIAIDLGTTNSVIGYIDQDEKEIDVLNMDNELLTPSFIWLQVDEKTGKVNTLVGRKAKEKMKEDPTNVVCSYKTKMGLTNGNNVVKNILDKDLTAEVCSSYALTYLKRSAEKFLNESITRALITVPARFTEAQRHSTKLAAMNAGLDVLRLLDEPSAAAFYYLYKDMDLGDARELDDGIMDDKTVLVYDLGGGTFDISLITVAGTRCAQIGTSGDTHLGGDNFDREIAIFVANKLGINFDTLSRNAQEKFIRLAEQAKIDISDNYYVNPSRVKSAVIPLDTVLEYLPDGSKRTYSLTKEQCFSCIDNYINNTMKFVKDLVDDCLEGDISQIHEVLLVGGSSRFPLIREKMINYLNDDRFDQEYFSKTLIDPDKAVCYGARKYMKAVLDGKEERLKTNIPNPVGVVLNDPVTGLEVFHTVLTKDTKLPTARPKALNTPVTNLIKGMSELVFKVQEGYSKNPQDNLTLGTIRIPLPPDAIDKPKTALYLIQIGVDENAIVSVSVRDNTLGSNGKTITKVFTHDDNGSGLEITTIDEAASVEKTSDMKSKLRRRIKRNKSSSVDEEPQKLSATKF